MPWVIRTILTVFVPLTLIYWYVGKKALNALTRTTKVDRRRLRWYVIGVIFYINIFPFSFLLVYLLGGQTRVPAFAGENLLVDILLIYPFWFGLVISVQAFLLFLLTDIVKLLSYPLYRRRREPWLLRQSKLVVTILIIVTIYSIGIIVKDTWTIRVNEYALKLPASAAELAGLKLVHISDVQGDGRTTEAILRRYVSKVNDLEPDLVFFAGDLVTSGEHYIASSADILGKIRARYGKIAAVGDHDIFSNKERVIEAMRENGFIIADDTSFTLFSQSFPLTVTLLTHTYRQRPEGSDLLRATHNANGRFKILLVHQPAESLVVFAKERNYNLFLAGHTHGGGISFGIPGLFLIAPARFESRYVSGFYRVGDMLVSVTNGLGMTLTPIRFHAPAEISVIRLIG